MNVRTTRTTLTWSSVILAATVPLMVQTTAHAATSRGGCTVTPLRPAYSGVDTAAGVSKVDYKIRVTCLGGRSIDVQQFRMEEDQTPRDVDNIDDVTGTTSRTLTFDDGADTRTITVRAPLPSTPGDGNREEVYHKVRFQVTSAGGPTLWTPFEASAVRSIAR